MANSEGQALKRSTSPSEDQSNNNNSSSIGKKLESTVITKFNKSLYTFNWQINNFDIICPQDCNEFVVLKSPVFTPDEDNGKKSSWHINISGIEKYIACYLHLHSVTQEIGGTGPNPSSQGVKCAFKMSLGNEDNHFCLSRISAAHKFTTGSGLGYPKLISIEELYEKKATLLQNQTICICVQMEIFGEPINTYISLPIKRKRNSESITDTFSSDFKKLFNKKKNSDVKIVCGERTFFAHKLILSTRSKVFSAMFNSKMKESTTSQVNLTDIDPDTAQSVLEYIYTGKVTLPAKSSYAELIYGAEKYDLPQLKDYCFDRLFENVNNNTIGTLAVASDTYNAEPEYKTAVKKLCQENIGTLQKNPDFKQLLMAHSRAFWDD